MENDLISRKSLLQNIVKKLGIKNEDYFTAQESVVISCIYSEPSAQPEQRWIPCSEVTGDGYPEKDGFYYVTEQNYGFYLDADYKQRVTHTSHFKHGDFTDRFYNANSSNITAWMPLPEPWKGEDNERS